MPYRATTSAIPRPGSVWILLVAFILIRGTCGDSLADQAPEGQTLLTAAAWRGSAYSHRASGIICWLSGEDGSLRVEVSEAAATPFADATGAGTNPLDRLQPLLTRRGNGWTMILGPDDAGTLNAWGKEWRQVPPGLAQVVRLVTVSLRDFPRSRPDFDFASQAGPPQRWADIPRPKFLGSGFSAGHGKGSWLYQLSPLELEDAAGAGKVNFRSGMVARGRGTGGNGEIISLEWIPVPGADDTALEITSSRRPGTLRLDPPRVVAVKKPEPEVFLPLWPLSQFIETR